MYLRCYALTKRLFDVLTILYLHSVIQDPTLHHHQVGHGGAFDARRVSSLDEVFTDEPNKIVPPGLPPTTSSSTASST